MCIVSAGRNLKLGNKYAKYLESMARLDYDNLTVVLVDDYSADGTVDAVK